MTCWVLAAAVSWNMSPFNVYTVVPVLPSGTNTDQVESLFCAAALKLSLWGPLSFRSSCPQLLELSIWIWTRLLMPSGSSSSMYTLICNLSPKKGNLPTTQVSRVLWLVRVDRNCYILILYTLLMKTPLTY